jgi:hypothetical protein
MNSILWKKTKIFSFGAQRFQSKNKKCVEFANPTFFYPVHNSTCKKSGSYKKSRRKEEEEKNNNNFFYGHYVLQCILLGPLFYAILNLHLHWAKQFSWNQGRILAGTWDPHEILGGTPISYTFVRFVA